MLSVTLPQKPKYASKEENLGIFEIHGCHPGYGTTLGNAIRRVLLSSLEGAAVSAVKIRGVSHEFSTLPGVVEDFVQIILNIKKIRIKADTKSDEIFKAVLKHKGEGKITAKDIKCPTGIKIVNPELTIATVTDKKAELEIEFEITRGLGYVAVEQQERKEKEIGIIAVDAIYTPIKRVNYEIENMRVGKRTDFDKITFEIATDGSISPKDAFSRAVKILIDQFSSLTSVEAAGEARESVKKVEETVSETTEKQSLPETDDPAKYKVTDLKSLSTRTINVLEENKILKVKDILKMSENDLRGLEGMGEKGIKEIKKSIGEFGLTLKSQA